MPRTTSKQPPDTVRYIRTVVENLAVGDEIFWEAIDTYTQPPIVVREIVRYKDPLDGRIERVKINNSNVCKAGVPCVLRIKTRSE